MPKSLSRKYRIFVSRLFAAVVVALILFSESKWDAKEPVDGAIFLVGVILVGIGTVGRLWCALYISGYKSNTLITTGPYSMCRNPLYFFSFLGAIGVGLTTETMAIPAVIIFAFVLYYPLVVLSEQKKLANIHKEAFSNYCEKTPSFFPSIKLLNEPEEYVVRPIIYRKAMFEVLWFIWLLGLTEMVESLHESGLLPIVFKLY